VEIAATPVPEKRVIIQDGLVSHPPPLDHVMAKGAAVGGSHMVELCHYPAGIPILFGDVLAKSPPPKVINLLYPFCGAFEKRDVFHHPIPGF
jgi:hypothetical protein